MMEIEPTKQQLREALKAFNLINPDIKICAVFQEDFIYRNTKVFWWKGIQYQMMLNPSPQDDESLEDFDDVEIVEVWKDFGNQ